MMRLRSQFIIDTNVLIDLYRGNVLNELFGLPYEFIAPDVIIEELREPDGRELTKMGLGIGEFNGEGVAEVAELLSHHRNIGATDIFALVLSSKKGLPLLTGDRQLRKLAHRKDIEIHGTLWILDEMISNGILSPVEATLALQNMLNKKSRLPHTECQDRFRRWNP